MDSSILILDGGLGTSLEQKHGCTFDHTTPLWSSDLLVSDPARLLRCQADFGRVPVDILQTATYQVSVAGFAKTRNPEEDADQQGISRTRIPHYVDAAVRIAQEAAAAPTTRLALSVGPYGACMMPSSQEYTGAYDAEGSSEEALLTWHRDRLQLFAAGVAELPARVSFVALETVPRVDELKAMRCALASTTPLVGIPFWTSCLFPAGTDEDPRMPDGSDVEAALRAMLDPARGRAAWGVGINCTKVGRRLDVLLRRYEEGVAGLLREGVVDRWPALVLYPDGTNGEVYDTVTRTWVVRDQGKCGEEKASWAERLAKAVRETQARGRWTQIVVGGCCRAGPEDIAALRAELL